MINLKPVVEEQSLLTLLAEKFDRRIKDLRAIDGGLVAQVFEFEVEGRAYIIRINSDVLRVNFEKELIVFQTYCSRFVPIPKVVFVGQFQDVHYGITEKASGYRFDELSALEKQKALPSAIVTLDAIHATDVSNQRGYGFFDGRGVGLFESWHASLLYITEERADGFIGKWHHLFKTTFLASMVTSKPAISGQRKTGQRRASETGLF